MTDFEGDVLLKDSPDGGEIEIKDGLISCDKGFSTAVYLSLFGGNEDDKGLAESNKGFWGNCLGDKKTRLVSRFQNVIKGCPLTPKNVLAACSAAKDDLDWMLEDKIADDISVTGRILSVTNANFHVKIMKQNANVIETEFGVNWEANNGI